MAMRFVKEYANYRICEFKEHAKACPEYREYWKGKVQLIEAYLQYWDKDLITVSEIMHLINEA